MEEWEKTSLFNIDADPEAEKAEVAIKPAVVIVDPFSTGAVLAADLGAQGYRVIALYSANLDHLVNVQSLVPKDLTISFEAVIPFNEDLVALVEILKALPKLSIVAVLAGAETGVELADELSETM